MVLGPTIGPTIGFINNPKLAVFRAQIKQIVGAVMSTLMLLTAGYMLLDIWFFESAAVHPSYAQKAILALSRAIAVIGKILLSDTLHFGCVIGRVR